MTESTLVPDRSEYVRETTEGETPADPDWQPYGNDVVEQAHTLAVNKEAQRGVGSGYASDHKKGAEDSTGSVNYLLAQSLVAINDPSSSTTVGVRSTDSSDTGVTVTVENDDGSVTEDITTDGTDGTSFVTGTTTFDTLGQISIGSTTTGDIEVLVDDSGSAGTLLATVPSGDTLLEEGQDAAYDGLMRDHRNPDYLPASHSAMFRKDRATGGNADEGIRNYDVYKGAKINSVTLELAADRALPIPVTLEYEIEKYRHYEIHQPAGDDVLTVYSSDSDDTMDITIETEGASTSETLTLNGTTNVTGSSNFPDVDAAELSSNPTGTITIEDSSGNVVLEIRGSDHYTRNGREGWEGDLGVPTLGAGSHAADLGLANEEIFRGHTVERPPGTNIAPNIEEAEVSVSNNIDKKAQNQNQRQNLREGDAEPEFSITGYGETFSRDSLDELVRAGANDLEWHATGFTFVIPNAKPFDDQERALSQGDDYLPMEINYRGRGVRIG